MSRKSKLRFVDGWRIFTDDAGVVWLEGQDRYRLTHVLVPVLWIGGAERHRSHNARVYRVYTADGLRYELGVPREGWVVPEKISSPTPCHVQPSSPRS